MFVDLEFYKAQLEKEDIFFMRLMYFDMEFFDKCHDRRTMKTFHKIRYRYDNGDPAFQRRNSPEGDYVCDFYLLPKHKENGYFCIDRTVDILNPNIKEYVIKNIKESLIELYEDLRLRESLGLINDDCRKFCSCDITRPKLSSDRLKQFDESELFLKIKF